MTQPLPPDPARDDDPTAVVKAERAFHEQEDEGRTLIRRLIKHYTEQVVDVFLQMAERLAGSNILNVGCGVDVVTPKLSLRPRNQIVGIDLSLRRLVQARRSGARDAVYALSDAHHLPFPNANFDTVIGIAVLHHLRLEDALRELARVTTAGGVAVFAEPLAYHPLIAAGRLLTPKSRTPDETPFRGRDWRVIKSLMEVEEEHYMHLTSPLAGPLAAFTDRPVRWLSRFDRWLFAHGRWARKLAWYVVFAGRFKGRHAGS